jgi:hypothetical protein
MLTRRRRLCWLGGVCGFRAEAAHNLVGNVERARPSGHTPKFNEPAAVLDRIQRLLGQ